MAEHLRAVQIFAKIQGICSADQECLREINLHAGDKSPICHHFVGLHASPPLMNDPPGKPDSRKVLRYFC
jgi:hypothetical protein